MQIPANNLRAGTFFIQNNNFYKVEKYNHKKVGRGQAIIKVKAKNLKSGNTKELRFTSNNNVTEVEVAKIKKEYIYHNERKSEIVLADPETKERFKVDSSVLEANEIKFLKEGINVDVITIPGSNEVLNIQIPLMVNLEVVQTGPSEKGDSAGSVTKPAKLESGATIQLPMFIKSGDVVKVNTENGEYVERV